MEKFNSELYQEKYKIKSIRLQNWDYSWPGYYFITICTKDKQCYFGDVIDDKMILNELGYIVKQCWRDLPNYYNNCKLDSFIIMPNHVHGIIQINYSNVEMGFKPVSTGKIKRYPLSEIIRGFKTFLSRKINLNDSNINFKWQKSYYDHIVRGEDDLNRIRNYIQNNPLNWYRDRNYL